MKSFFFKIIIFIGITGLLFLLAVGQGKAAITVEYPANFYAGRNFELTLTSTDPNSDYQLWSSPKCLTIALVDSESIWYSSQFDIRRAWSDHYPNSTIEAATSTTFIFTNTDIGHWTNVLWYAKTMQGIDCGDEDMQDYDLYGYTPCIMGDDDIDCNSFQMSTFPMPTSTSQATLTTTTVQIIDNPLQNIWNGLILFFIMLFGMVFYFKKS